MARSRFLFSPFEPGSLPFSFFAERLVSDADFRADLKRVAELPEQRFIALAEALAAHPTFLNRAEFADIVTKTAGDQRLTNTLARLNKMMRDSSDTIDDALGALIAEVSGHDDFAGPIAKTVEARLRAVLVVPRALAKQKKAESLAEATGAELNDVAIICDIRPVFDEERKVVEGAIPLTTLRVEVQEPDGRIASVECRLTEEQLERLCKLSDAARRKLSVVKEMLKSKSVAIATTHDGSGAQQ